MGWREGLVKIITGAKEAGRVAGRVATSAKDEVKKTMKEREEQYAAYVAKCRMIGDYVLKEMATQLKDTKPEISAFGKPESKGIEKYFPGFVKDDVQIIVSGTDSKYPIALINHTQQKVTSYNLEAKQAVDSALALAAKENPAMTTYRSEVDLARR